MLMSSLCNINIVLFFPTLTDKQTLREWSCVKHSQTESNVYCSDLIFVLFRWPIGTFYGNIRTYVRKFPGHVHLWFVAKFRTSMSNGIGSLFLQTLGKFHRLFSSKTDAYDVKMYTYYLYKVFPLFFCFKSK